MNSRVIIIYMKTITDQKIQEVMNILVSENIKIQAYLAIQQMFERLPVVESKKDEKKD